MKKHKVVLLMKDPALAEDLHERLENLNCIVSGNYRAVKEGIRGAQAVGADIVFLDLMLKGEIEGMEAVRILRYNLGIPVVLVTGFANTRLFHLMKQMYRGSLLNLPVQDAELSDALDLALDELTPLRSGLALRRMEDEISVLAN